MTILPDDSRFMLLQYPRPPPAASGRLFVMSNETSERKQPGSLGRACRATYKEHVMVRRYGFWFLALGCLACLHSLVEAGTIGGLDSFANTVQEYLKGNVGKMLAMILAIAGIAMVVAGKMGLGISGMACGIAIAFVPNIIGDAFDATEAATLAGAVPFVPWAAGDGLLNLLARVGLVLLWPVVPVLKYGRDPVVWLAVGIVLALRPTALYRHLHEAALHGAVAAMRAVAPGSLCRVG